MRRIYESQALDYDDEDPHKPKRKQTRRDEHQTRRAINWDSASHALFPSRLRPLAIAVSVETDRDVYPVDAPVNFRATFLNRIPFPVALKTESPVRWRWSIDGVEEASHVTDHPKETTLFRFGRGERKTFHRQWTQRFQMRAHTWESAARGDHTLEVRMSVPGAKKKGLVAETTFRIE